MLSQILYRTLVPDAPLFRRTEADARSDRNFLVRANLSALLEGAPPQPGLGTPSLISSFEGAIERLLFAWPSFVVDEPAYADAYRSLIAALRVGTEFIVVHHEDVRPAIEAWFNQAGHPAANITYVPLPSYVSFTDWAEDAYVSLRDADDDTHYLMEPWRFLRAGDALIADAVEQYSSIQATQAPLIFQGGNCLIGSALWLLGKDYFADSVELVGSPRPPVNLPQGTDAASFVRTLFTDFVDKDRRLVTIGTDRPIPVPELTGTKQGNSYFLDIGGDGVGTFQPIFHIDMFITLAGPDGQGRQRVLVGSPALANQMLGTSAPLALDDVYDRIADMLAAEGFQVIRNPLVHQPTLGRTYTLAQLRTMAEGPDGAAVGVAVRQLVAAGARDQDNVRVRSWHHITWNNCLVEDSTSEGRHVYLPTFGHAPYANLAAIDAHMDQLWQSLGFTVHRLGDFNPFARRQGVVHCIKKYLKRGG